MKRRINFLMSVCLFVTLAVSLAACGAPAAPTAEAPQAPAAPAEPAAPAVPAEPAAPAQPAEETDFISWYQYDQNNEDPASDERVGNAYLRKTIPEFNAAFEGKWNWVNVPKAFDKLYTELVAASISGGDVPDVFEGGASNLNLVYNNGVAMDLTDWAKEQAWYNDLDPHAVQACMRDGKLYCIPFAQRPFVTFVWADRFPAGYPATTDEFLKESERLKKEGLYSMTLFGSTAFDGAAVYRGYFTIINSFGGSYDDGKGNLRLNTPENVAAIEFIRELVNKQYMPEIIFAGGFQEEEAFKDASAASIPTGIFGYRYINPLTAPSGKKYDKGNENDMLDAIEAGDVIISPSFAAPGKLPGCNNDVAGLSIPVGAKHPEAAYDYINWLMDPTRNAEFVFGPGAGIPVLKSAMSDPKFQTAFYQQAAKAVENSACTPWFGSLERPEEAGVLIVNAIYKLVKEDPKADIATVLAQAEKEYNTNN